jgi:hypothetical protein
VERVPTQTPLSKSVRSDKCCNSEHFMTSSFARSCPNDSRFGEFLDIPGARSNRNTRSLPQLFKSRRLRERIADGVLDVLRRHQQAKAAKNELRYIPTSVPSTRLVRHCSADDCGNPTIAPRLVRTASFGIRRPINVMADCF